ncbi:MAG: hypothetical protein Kow0010_08620 [Dehalococcoidia bacterium]
MSGGGWFGQHRLSAHSEACAALRIGSNDEQRELVCGVLVAAPPPCYRHGKMVDRLDRLSSHAAAFAGDGSALKVGDTFP